MHDDGTTVTSLLEENIDMSPQRGSTPRKSGWPNTAAVTWRTVLG